MRGGRRGGREGGDTREAIAVSSSRNTKLSQHQAFVSRVKQTQARQAIIYHTASIGRPLFIIITRITSHLKHRCINRQAVIHHTASIGRPLLSSFDHMHGRMRSLIRAIIVFIRPHTSCDSLHGRYKHTTRITMHYTAGVTCMARVWSRARRRSNRVTRSQVTSVTSTRT